MVNGCGEGHRRSGDCDDAVLQPLGTYGDDNGSAAILKAAKSIIHALLAAAQVPPPSRALATTMASTHRILLAMAPKHTSSSIQVSGGHDECHHCSHGHHHAATQRSTDHENDDTFAANLQARLSLTPKAPAGAHVPSSSQESSPATDPEPLTILNLPNEVLIAIAGHLLTIETDFMQLQPYVGDEYAPLPDGRDWLTEILGQRAFEARQRVHDEDEHESWRLGQYLSLHVHPMRKAIEALLITSRRFHHVVEGAWSQRVKSELPLLQRDIATCLQEITQLNALMAQIQDYQEQDTISSAVTWRENWIRKTENSQTLLRDSSMFDLAEGNGAV